MLSLAKGDVVESVGRKGMYWKVKTQKGKVGYVSVLKVKRQSAKSSKIQSVIREAAKDSRADGNNTSIRSRSAVMGVRGLSSSEQVAYAGNIKPDLRLVYRMEDRVVQSKKLDLIEQSIALEIEKKVDTSKFAH